MKDIRLRTLADHWDLFRDAMQARDVDDIQALVARYARTLGFENFGYAQKTSAATGNYRYFHDFVDPAWAAQYNSLSQPQAERTDPRILQARHWLPASGWDSLGRCSVPIPPFLKTITHKRLLLTGEFGIHSGITVPIRAPGIEWAFMSFTLRHRVPLREFEPVLLGASYFTACLQAAMTRICAAAAPLPPKLSGPELETLRWSAIGKTSWEISVIQRISEATVNYRLKRAAAKLGVKGRRAAVARAIALGLLSL